MGRNDTRLQQRVDRIIAVATVRSRDPAAGIEKGTPIPLIPRDCLAGAECAQGVVAMSVLTIIVTIVIVGVILWAINSFIPMDGKIRSILNAVVVILLIIWLLQAFGVLGSLRGVHVG